MSAAAAPVQAVGLPAATPAAGQRFALYHPPHGTARAKILFLHAFAEEMNKSRRMAALAARALAAQGYAVLQIDLRGCGDSSGDFGEASWSDWLDDTELGAGWLNARHTGPLWLWGHRAGCLLATEAGRERIDGERHYLLWQPPAAGAPLLQQFLRLKVAGLMQDGAGRAIIQGLRRELAEGRAVEIAGYRLGSGLASGLEAASLEPPAYNSASRLVWLETSARDTPALLPASGAAIEKWRSAGCDVVAEAVRGPSFWQTVEIEEAPALIDATVRHLCRLDTLEAAA